MFQRRVAQPKAGRATLCATLYCTALSSTVMIIIAVT